MKRLSLTLVVMVAVAIGIAASPAFAKKGGCQCMPGSSSAEYCEHKPPHHRDDRRGGKDEHGRSSAHGRR